MKPARRCFLSSGWSGEGWLRQARRVDSPNFGPRPDGCEVSLVVIHNISLPPGVFSGEAVTQFFTNQLDPAEHPYFAAIAASQVSAHFFLRRNGELLQFVSADQRAWHAGVSSWRGRAQCNDYSIGIELEGCDDLPYAAAQYTCLQELLQAVCARYPIAGVAGHSDIAPGRKTDPGSAFDWDWLHGCFPALLLR